MSSIRLMGLVQVFLALGGMAWKVKEGYPLIQAPDFARLFESVHTESGHQLLYTWLELLGDVSVESLLRHWPWFSLHLFLYTGQLIPFILMILTEPHPGRRVWANVGTVAVLGVLSALGGFAMAMPIVSLWMLRKGQPQKSSQRTSSGGYRRSLLASLFIFSTVTHVGAFAVACFATWTPSLLAHDAAAPLQLINSLTGVPSPVPVGVTDAAVRQARLRQINEMTGTSSGFFMAAGLLFRALESQGHRITSELVAWMFFVSLIAGPGAGGAVVLLLRDWIVGGGTGDEDAVEKAKTRDKKGSSISY